MILSPIDLRLPLSGLIANLVFVVGSIAAPDDSDWAKGTQWNLERNDGYECKIIINDRIRHAPFGNLFEYERTSPLSLSYRSIQRLITLTFNADKATGAYKDDSGATGKLTILKKNKAASVNDDGKPVKNLASAGLRSLEIHSGVRAEEILKRFHPLENLAYQARAEASTSHRNTGQPDVVLKQDRPNILSEMDDKAVWCLTGQQGWLRLKWERPVRGITIVLINRPRFAKPDLWIDGQIFLNGASLTQFHDFGRGEVAVIELKQPVEIQELQIECSKGTWAPGLYSVEIYSENPFSDNPS